MNLRSISPVYISNQHNSLWNDEFKHRASSKGMQSMDNQRNLAEFAELLVANYATYNGDEYLLSFVKLPAHEKSELARLYIEVNDRETSECIYDGNFSLNNDFTRALLTMLKNDTRENREAFSKTTINNIIKYYAISLQEILDEACVTYHQNIMNESGYFQSQDNDHGDNVWRKF